MKVLAVINYNGGVGETALTTNLAGKLAWRKHRVLMIDLDPQASLTFSFLPPHAGKKIFAESGTIKAWFDTFDGQGVPDVTNAADAPVRASRNP